MGVRVILTTGGTGGHIFPALAVAEQLRREGAELLFVGSQYGSEAKLAKQAGLEFRGLPVRGVLGRGLRSVGALWGLFRAVFMARAIVKDFRPDAVIGFGAYASFPSLVAAKRSHRGARAKRHAGPDQPHVGEAGKTGVPVSAGRDRGF